MNNDSVAIGEIVLVGRVAYQKFSRTYRGNVEFYARIGKPYTSKTTGATSIIPHMMDDSTRDFLEASQRAAKELEEIRNAAFRHQVNKSAATVSAISPITQDELEDPVVLKFA